MQPANRPRSEEEDAEDYAFPLTLRSKRTGNPTDEYQATTPTQLDGTEEENPMPQHQEKVSVNGKIRSAASVEASIDADAAS